MLENARALDEKLTEKFRDRYAKSKLLKAATNVLYTNELSKAVMVMPQKGNTTHHFSIEIDTMSVTNQKSSGRCWLFAALNLLREQVSKKHNIKEFELSQNYAAFWDKYEKANWFLECVIDLADREIDDRTLCNILSTGMQDGGQWDMLVNLFEKYGVVPQEAMPETANSSATKSLNTIMEARLIRCAVALRDAFEKNFTSVELLEIKEDALSDIYSMLCAAFGVPPKTFDFEYKSEPEKGNECAKDSLIKEGEYHIHKNLTPIEFYRNYTDGNLSEYASFINSPTIDKPYYKTYTVDYIGNVVGGNPIFYLNLPMDELEDLAIRELKEGNPVWFGSDVSYFGVRDSGIWDDGMFDYETLFDMEFELTKDQGLDYRYSAMNHAMLLTGVTLDENDKPVKWKVENSWGDKSGEKGYYIMSESWFKKYVYQVVARRGLLNDKQKEALTKAPIHLAPWDPMGTLASVN